MSFLQSGGFPGLVKGFDLDSAALEPAAAAEVERLVRQSGLTASGSVVSEGGRDLKRYDLVIEGAAPAGEPGSEPVRVTLDDSTVPAPARDLLAYLKQRARPRPLA